MLDHDPCNLQRNQLSDGWLDSHQSQWFSGLRHNSEYTIVYPHLFSSTSASAPIFNRMGMEPPKDCEMCDTIRLWKHQHAFLLLVPLYTLYFPELFELKTSYENIQEKTYILNGKSMVSTFHFLFNHTFENLSDWSHLYLWYPMLSPYLMNLIFPSLFNDSNYSPYVGDVSLRLVEAEKEWPCAIDLKGASNARAP